MTQLREEIAELKVDKAKLQDKCEELQRKVVERCEEDEASRLYDELEATRQELLEAKEGKECVVEAAVLWPICVCIPRRPKLLLVVLRRRKRMLGEGAAKFAPAMEEVSFLKRANSELKERVCTALVKAV
jgi:hypothetical protein